MSTSLCGHVRKGETKPCEAAMGVEDMLCTVCLEDVKEQIDELEPKLRLAYQAAIGPNPNYTMEEYRRMEKKVLPIVWEKRRLEKIYNESEKKRIESQLDDDASDDSDASSWDSVESDGSTRVPDNLEDAVDSGAHGDSMGVPDDLVDAACGSGNNSNTIAASTSFSSEETSISEEDEDVMESALQTKKEADPSLLQGLESLLLSQGPKRQHSLQDVACTPMVVEEHSFVQDSKLENAAANDAVNQGSDR